MGIVDLESLPCIIVVHEALALLSDVSPQDPSTARWCQDRGEHETHASSRFLSCTKAPTRYLSASWSTTVSASTMRRYCDRNAQSRIARKVGEGTHLVEGRVHSDDVLDLVVHLELGGGHRDVKVHAVEEPHEEHLRVALPAIPGARPLGRETDLDDHLRAYIISF